jgi:hypothetical protein
MAKERSVTEADVERAVNWMRENVVALAQARAERQHVEAWVKVIEAEEQTIHAGEPAYAQQREARASQRYKDGLNALRDAVKAEEELKYRWQLAQTVCEIWRTMEASRRTLDRAAA